MQKTIWYTAINSPLGKLYLAATDRGLARIMFGKRYGESLFLNELLELYPAYKVQRNPVPFRKVIKWLTYYFAGKKPAVTGIKFDFQSGTSFQQSVWKTLYKIPYGQVRSYQWVAERIGNPKSVRAVGQANGKNPISILVPCHRVINKDGSLGGYSGGINIKKKLLKIEGIFINSKSQIQKSK